MLDCYTVGKLELIIFDIVSPWILERYISASDVDSSLIKTTPTGKFQ